MKDGETRLIISPDYFRDVCICIGQIVVPFAQIEASLDMSIATIYQNGGKSHADELPRTLSRRIAYVRRCLKKMKALEPAREEGSAVLTALYRESNIRNNVVHGYLYRFDDETGAAGFRLLDAFLDKHMHTERVHTYTLVQMMESGDRLIKIGKRMNLLTLKIGQLLQIEDVVLRAREIPR